MFAVDRKDIVDYEPAHELYVIEYETLGRDFWTAMEWNDIVRFRNKLRRLVKEQEALSYIEG